MEDSLVKRDIKCYSIQHLHHATLPKQYEKKKKNTPPKENLIQISYAFPDLFPTLLKGGKIPEGIEETTSPDPAVTSALDAQAAAPQEPGWKSFQENRLFVQSIYFKYKGHFFMKICLLEPRIKYIKSPHFSLAFTFVFWTFKISIVNVWIFKNMIEM